MDTLLKDVRFGIRRLIKSPGFAFVAIISLALGVGANTAIFSLVNTILLRPFPVADPERIYSLSITGPGGSLGSFSYPGYVDFRDRNEVLDGLYASRFAPISFSREGHNQRIWGYLVSGNYFDVLGVQAVHGRTFLPEEDRTQLTHPVAVISHDCWRTRFGGDPAVIGMEVTLNGRPFEIVGVTPQGFSGTELIFTPEIWVPMMMQPWIEPGYSWLESRRTENIFATGRLKPGVSVAQAEASLNLLANQLGREYPDTNEGQKVSLVKPGFVLPNIRGAFVSFTLVLFAAVVLVLLIACANLAGLLLARATDRRREIAIRLAVGAGRNRLVRQLLTESTILSIAGGLVGLLLAMILVDLLVAFRPPIDLPISFALAVDWRVFAFTAVVSVVTGIVFGLAPALQSTRPDLVDALKDSSSRGGTRGSRLRRGLIVAQIALSFTLLIGAGLVVRALGQVQTKSPGFQPENALTLSFDIGLQGYDDEQGRQFQREALERIRSLPGIQAAAITNFLPLSLNYNAARVYVEGDEPRRGANVPTVMTSAVSLDYFEAMEIPLLHGRDFAADDETDAQRVAIVNESFAREFFPGSDSADVAIGKGVRLSTAESPLIRIVGVVGDGKYFNIGEEPRPFLYTSQLQRYFRYAVLVARTSADPGGMIGAVRNEVQQLDPALPIYDVKTMNEHLSLSLFPARIAAIVLGGFGLLALTLAAVGIYGVTSHSVAQRTREIGVRVALGARTSDVVRMIFRQGILLVVPGVLIGLAVALLLTNMMAGMLYGVSPTDPLTYTLISLVLVGAAVMACLAPALRAARIEPMIALRTD